VKLTERQMRVLRVYADHQRGVSRFGEPCPLEVMECARVYTNGRRVSERSVLAHLAVLRRKRLMDAKHAVTARGISIADEAREIPF